MLSSQLTLVLKRSLFLFALIGLTASGVASAQMYKWVDDKGVTHYSDSPTENYQSKQVSDQNLNIIGAPRESKRVEMYSVESCGFCKQAAKWMAKNDIPLIDYDIDKNPIARREYQRLGRNVTPVMKLGDTTVTGFGEYTKRQIIAYIDDK